MPIQIAISPSVVVQLAHRLATADVIARDDDLDGLVAVGRPCGCWQSPVWLAR
jgi:hypothetical protein